MPITIVFCEKNVTNVSQFQISSSVKAYSCSEYLYRKIIVAKPDKEVREIDTEVQNTRFHQDADNKLQLLRSSAILACP